MRFVMGVKPNRFQTGTNFSSLGLRPSSPLIPKERRGPGFTLKL
jgi:hypothetical protein